MLNLCTTRARSRVFLSVIVLVPGHSVLVRVKQVKIYLWPYVFLELRYSMSAYFAVRVGQNRLLIKPASRGGVGKAS